MPSVTDIFDRIYAGFIGKAIGVRLGAPVEPTIWSYERVRDTYGEVTQYLRDFKNFAADDDTTEGRAALLELAAHWTSESNGRVDATGVEGSVEGALRALGLTEARVVEISPADAFAHMGWAGASGGAHGRRRGAATGRFAAWWTAAALVDLTHDWPLTSDELEVASKEMKWYLWDEGHEPVGWSLRLGVEDPEAHMAWALRATDEA